MVIDHIGYKFFPEGTVTYEIMRDIGRVAYPMFAFLIAHNFLFYSRNHTNYLKRILLLALISEYPHHIYFPDHHTTSIMFTLALGVSAMIIAEKEKSKVVAFTAYIFMIFISFFTEYPLLGFILILSFYVSLQKKSLIYWAVTFLVAFLMNFDQWDRAIVSALAVLIPFAVSKLDISIPRMNKWAFYFFYPVHFLVLLVVYHYYS